MIDVHSHLLPGLDDGARDVGEMEEMLSVAEGDGVSKILATPHFVPWRYEVPYDEVASLIGELGLGGRVFPGQEVSLEESTLASVREGAVRGLNGGSRLLVELSFSQYREEYLSQIFELQQEGFEVVVAHPERYPYFVADPRLLGDFVREGVRFQVNGLSLLGGLGPGVLRFVEGLARAGLVDLVGSDCHDARRRPPKLREALEVLEGFVPGLSGVVQENAGALLEHRPFAGQERRSMAAPRGSVLGFFRRR